MIVPLPSRIAICVESDASTARFSSSPSRTARAARARDETWRPLLPNAIAIELEHPDAKSIVLERYLEIRLVVRRPLVGRGRMRPVQDRRRPRVALRVLDDGGSAGARVPRDACERVL